MHSIMIFPISSYMAVIPTIRCDVRWQIFSRWLQHAQNLSECPWFTQELGSFILSCGPSLAHPPHSLFLVSQSVLGEELWPRRALVGSPKPTHSNCYAALHTITFIAATVAQYSLYRTNLFSLFQLHRAEHYWMKRKSSRLCTVEAIVAAKKFCTGSITVLYRTNGSPVHVVDAKHTSCLFVCFSVLIASC